MWQEYLSNKVRRQEYLTNKVNLVQCIFFADYDNHSLDFNTTPSYKEVMTQCLSDESKTKKNTIIQYHPVPTKRNTTLPVSSLPAPVK